MIFSSFVTVTNSVRMYGRRDGDRQFLACELAYSSDGHTAMILPLPTAIKDRDRWLQTHSLSVYKDLFKDLDRAFSRDSSIQKAPKSVPVLEYVNPNHITLCASVTELAKIDQRFRLSNEFWSQLPQYCDGSYAVVILPDTGGRLKGVNPFSISFKSRLSGVNEPIHFPTLQIRNCYLDRVVQFHYEIYYQGSRRLLSDYPSTHPIEESMDFIRSRPLLVDGLAYKRVLNGKTPNSDVVV